MNNKLLTLLLAFLMVFSGANALAYNIIVDKNGVMRRSDNGAEVSFYGVNYTVPFAHAYRALGYLGVDHKEAIDRDVYHFSRLGFNAFRLHLWDVEISDAQGNLIENDHLDLLDYLITKLEERGISIILTAQTNFGNGYPERNTDTGAYSYDFGKCDIHDNPAAIAIQEKYIKALVGHKNSYNGKTYAADDNIIAIEINNEPCHSGDAEAACNYINRMVEAVRDGGFEKPIFYNVSHNMHCTEGFYAADIQGTTYQWYPLGLVAGHQRRGNFLPIVDNYEIHFSDVEGFDSKARMIYEFDPADNLYSCLYPTVARTFRKAGFQWITQFAYDPIDMAWSNTEYQTHFLNLAYTPGKAISMKIAAKVTEEVGRGEDFGTYPADTVFGNFRVSYAEDLSEYVTAESFYYTNNTGTSPADASKLEHIAGVGSSPVVGYAGSGAYFLDRLDKNTWRLEVMPDVVLTCDPFEKPSLKRHVGEIIYGDRGMTISLPSLGKDFSYKAVNDGNSRSGKASDGRIDIYPGVYLLTKAGKASSWNASSQYGAITVGEYVAPAQREIPVTVAHKPQSVVPEDEELTIYADVLASAAIDSAVVYPAMISFWNEHNMLYKMSRTDSPYGYEAKVKVRPGAKEFGYNIVVFSEGKAVTFPEGVEGTPLDWDWSGQSCYNVNVASPYAPLVLLKPSADWNDGLEMSSIPDGQRFMCRYSQNSPVRPDAYELEIETSSDTTEIVLSKYVGDIIAPAAGLLEGRKIAVSFNAEGGSAMLALVTKTGTTYTCPLEASDGIATVSLGQFKPDLTRICPAPYPVFCSRTVSVPAPDTIDIADVERIAVIFTNIKPGSRSHASLAGIWIE